VSAIPSWSGKPAAPPPEPTGLVGRLRVQFRDFSWFDTIALLLGLLVWDLVTGLVLSGYFSVRCGAQPCTLHQNLHRDHMLLWLIPLVMFLPPVLMVLWRRKMRGLVIGVQVVVLGALLIHTVHDAHVQRQRIDGTVPCWNKLYTPKECPWGSK